VRIQVWIAIAVHVLVALNSMPFCFARHNNHQVNPPLCRGTPRV
jgi:hypothetical protein